MNHSNFFIRTRWNICLFTCPTPSHVNTVIIQNKISWKTFSFAHFLGMVNYLIFTFIIISVLMPEQNTLIWRELIWRTIFEFSFYFSSLLTINLSERESSYKFFLLNDGMVEKSEWHCINCISASLREKVCFSLRPWNLKRFA